VSSLGDGVTMVAGPLLVATLTDDPALVAGALFAQQLPWLLFSLVSGAYVDRFPGPRLLAGVNLVRGAAIGGLAVAVAGGAPALPLVYAAFFVLGTGETVAENAAAALLPSVVPAAQLARANARLGALFTVGNQLAAKPLGAWLFAVAAALPFGFDAATFAVAAALVAALPHRPAAPPAARGSLRADVVEGVRWLMGHRVLRLLTLCIGVMNVTFCAAFATLVLYARDRLGLGAVGYGVLLATGAVGGLLGTAVVSRLEARLGAGPLLRAGLVVEAATHLVLALTRTPWVAGVTLTLFGVHAMVWGVVTMSLRQRAVPEPLLGRVLGVYALFSSGGAALGTLAGGLLAHGFGLTAPFWVAFAAIALLAVATWSPFGAAGLTATAGGGGREAPVSSEEG
jgi:MFS family permease